MVGVVEARWISMVWKPSTHGWTDRQKVWLWDEVGGSCKDVRGQAQTRLQLLDYRLLQDARDLVRQTDCHTEKKQNSIAATIDLLHSVIVN